MSFCYRLGNFLCKRRKNNINGGINLAIKKIGIMTGGGDCPGLNAVIAAAVKTAVNKYGL